MSALSRADALLEAVLRRLDRVIDVSAGEAETNAALRQQARRIYFQAYPRQRGRVQVHHRIPLEWWRRVFRGTDPNRLANLAHQFEDEPQVVQARQRVRQQLVGGEQVA